MSSNYGKGYQSGIWTDEQLNRVKATPEELLVLAETNYQEELAAFSRRSQEWLQESGASHREYLNGHIDGVRDSLSRHFNK